VQGASGTFSGTDNTALTILPPISMAANVTTATTGPD